MGYIGGSLFSQSYRLTFYQILIFRQLLIAAEQISYLRFTRSKNCYKPENQVPDMDIEPKIGNQFTHSFKFSQEDVAAFARVTGDTNPLHLDADYAATTAFKRPILHGMLGASVFTKVLGTEYPGYGSIYVSQTLSFQRPMFVDTEYEAVFIITSIDPVKHTAEISTEILDSQTRKVTTRGAATMINKEKF